jgi:hypothetical protein
MRTYNYLPASSCLHPHNSLSQTGDAFAFGQINAHRLALRIRVVALVTMREKATDMRDRYLAALRHGPRANDRVFNLDS